MNNKLSTFVLVLLLSTLTISGCEAITTDQPQGWITYVNEKHGYSLWYPPDCTFGAMSGYCKEKPPEERPQECLCILNAENPDQVGLQAFTGESDELTLATFQVSHPDTPVYNPPAGADLISWVKEKFPYHENIPDEPNMEIGGISAVRIYTPQSPMAFSFEDIYFLKDNKLFNINMVDVDNEDNQDLYDKLLTSFGFDQ